MGYKKCPLFVSDTFIFKKERIHMPYVTVQMLEGRSDEQRKALIEKVTDAVVETTGATREKVVVFVEDIDKRNYGVGGKRLVD
ncbi:4-oxalocrotonate tautomerase [Gracilibacillus salitolerans]|uniref:Tautomerase n=1 Tax=Gracilibacillus salitolerans TaxID=2663022 RepID=A0A5Q2TSJ2_9BACI|nr:4-oxalocrotonate tautomerase [Gracilibacillus salitolerans]